MRPPPGFTLLEVLLALLIITIGLLGLAGTLGPVSALAGEGRIHGRIALIAASRLDLLRAGQLAGAPACAVPAAGGPCGRRRRAMDRPCRRRFHRSGSAGGIAGRAARLRGHDPHPSVVSLTRRDATLARRATLARGASLAELVAALTVSAVLALLAGRILATAAGHLRSRSERIGLEHSLPLAASGLRAALRSGE